MPTIDQLSQSSGISDFDEFPFYSKANGSTRKVTASQLAAHVLQSMQDAPREASYSMTTDGSNFTVAVLPPGVGGNVWAQIALSAAAPAGTIVLPGAEDRMDGQEVLVTCTQPVAVLTVSGNGAALSGVPASIGPGTPFRLRFDALSNTWYRAI